MKHFTILAFCLGWMVIGSAGFMIFEEIKTTKSARWEEYSDDSLTKGFRAKKVVGYPQSDLEYDFSTTFWLLGVGVPLAFYSYRKKSFFR